MLLIPASCITNEVCADLGTCPNKVEERTDILVSGTLDIWDNQVVDNGVIDEGPISFNYYGMSSDRFDFVIDLASGYTLVIGLVSTTTPDPQTQAGLPFNAYPGHDLSERGRFVKAELRRGNDAPVYSTNASGNIMPEVILSAFEIIYNDGDQIRARIREMKMYHNIENSKEIKINGTFVAVANYGDLI
jgi:hypothetical protein